MNFKRITVKLAVAFAILIAVLLAIGWLGLSRMTLMNGNIQEIVDQRWRKVQLSREALRLSALNSRITMQIFLLRDRADIDPLLQQRAANTQSISDLLKQIEAQLDSAKEKALIAAVWTNRIPYVESYKRALDLLLKENAPEAGREMMANIVTPNLIAYHKSWEAFVAHQGERMDQAGEDAEAYYVSARQMVVTLLTLSVILATLIAVFVTQGTNREVTQRIQAQQELVEAHAALERRVEERTAELGAEVAERKTAQEKLTEALRSMAAIDAVLDRSCIIVRTDLDGTITHVNDNLCRLAEYDREELIGQNHRILESNQQADASTQGMWKTVAEGRIWRGEVESRSKGGRAYWVDSTIGPLLDDQGKPRGYMAIRTDITARKEDEAKVAELNRRLVDASRQAGMAEVATGVLHNVGNVLNSVNVSANLVAEKLKKSKGASLGRIASVLQEQEKNLVEFLTKDSKGQHLPALLSSLAETLAAEQTSLLAELATLQKNIGHIKDVVTMQQSYAKISAVTETVKLAELIEDTLRMNAASLAHHDIKVIREFADVPPIEVDKHRLLQVLVNLVRNARHACKDSAKPEKQLTLRLEKVGHRVRITVSDNGVGIPAENLTRIFNHGFTTKKNGHGFGLHSGANATKEMGGTLTAHSDGVGQGATFILELPLAPELRSSHVKPAEPAQLAA